MNKSIAPFVLHYTRILRVVNRPQIRLDMGAADATLKNGMGLTPKEYIL